MSSSLVDNLKGRVKELEEELLARQADIESYRAALIKANERLEKMIVDIRQELKLAQKLQSALVPTELPNIQGVAFSSKFLSGRLRGGDYFDIFEMQDRMSYGVIVSACSGYAISSLLLSALIRFTGQIEARKGGAPDKMLKMIARELVKEMEDKDQAQIFYGIIDRRSFELNYTCMGDIMALHWVSESGQLEQLEPVTPSLCVDFDFSHLKAQRVVLNPKDRIILATPGLAQAQNINGDRFGIENLLSAILGAPKLGVHELRNEIIYQMKKFCQGKELEGDVTVIVQEVNERIIKLAT